MTVDPAAGTAFRADPSSLRSDSATWSGAALTLAEAATAAGQLRVDSNAFSHLANLTTGVDQIYAALQVKLAGLLGQGVTSFNDIAAALTTTAATYADADQLADEDIRKAAAPSVDLGPG